MNVEVMEEKIHAGCSIEFENTEHGNFYISSKGTYQIMVVKDDVPLFVTFISTGGVMIPIDIFQTKIIITNLDQLGSSIFINKFRRDK